MSESPTGCEELISRYGLTPDDERAGFYRGFICSVSGYDVREPAGFDDQDRWADGSYRRVWVSETERAIFTYCEGDLKLATYSSEELFTAAHRAADAYYVGLRD
jgi:hypothetical protein